MSAPEANPTLSVDTLSAHLGKEVGVSDWVLVDQPMIDAFAEVSGDHQFIHVDPVRAAATPFGATIAHGFLVLSLLSRLRAAAVPPIAGVAMGINYGFERVRFTAPVRSGSRIRGRFALTAFDRKSESQTHVTWQLTWSATVEIEHEQKPALVAEWLTQAVVAL